MQTFIILIFLFFCTLTKAAANCPADSYSVRSHFRRAHIKSDGTYVKAANVKLYCKAKTKSYDFWNDNLKNGLAPGWPNKNEKPTTWSEDEKETVLELLDEIPQDLWPQKVKIFRLKKSKDAANPASNDGNNIVLYDSAFEEKGNLGQIMTHEFSHIYYERLPMELKRDYWLVSGGKPSVDNSGRVYIVHRDKGFVEPDGITSFPEDFSNNVEYFLYRSDRLKEVTPKAHDWIKKHFGKDFKLKVFKK